MNFLFLLFSLFFSTVTPSIFNNEGTSGNNNQVTVKKTTDNGGKTDGKGSGDFIIGNDTNP